MARTLLGVYFALCAGFTVWHGLHFDEPLASRAGVALAVLATYCLLSATTGHLAIQRVEAITIKSVVSVLVVVSTLVTMAAELHWLRQPVYSDNQPEVPKLVSIVRNDPDPYFRFVRVDDTNLWSLEARRRGLRAFSLYFPPSFAYSLIYLNPQHDIKVLRPHWVQLGGCDDFDFRALDLLGVKYVFCGRASLSSPDWKPVAVESGQTSFRRQDYDGGIRLYCRWRAMDEESPLRARDAVLLAFGERIALVSADDAASMPPPASDCPLANQPIGKVELVRDRPDRMVLNVTAEKAGMLVIPDNFSPGWHAWVNGKATNVMKVYHAYLGVRVEPGQNSITLEFRDDYFWIGLAISVMTVAGLALYLGISARKQFRGLIEMVRRPVDREIIQ